MCFGSGSKWSNDLTWLWQSIHVCSCHFIWNASLSPSYYIPSPSLQLSCSSWKLIFCLFLLTLDWKWKKEMTGIQCCILCMYMGFCKSMFCILPLLAFATRKLFKPVFPWNQTGSWRVHSGSYLVIRRSTVLKWSIRFFSYILFLCQPRFKSLCMQASNIVQCEPALPSRPSLRRFLVYCSIKYYSWWTPREGCSPIHSSIRSVMFIQCSKKQSKVCIIRMWSRYDLCDALLLLFQSFW